MPVDEVHIETLMMNDMGLGKIIYSKKQLKSLPHSKTPKVCTRRAYLAEKVEMA